ncbi:hypothetical protein OS493_002337 [Desmophyllum pertusum]|uniref:Uncharacterized protein n=1 Tax=Desmophyllum pertusum TaxID=174260 RepID=A0A9W9YU71_9CNID|nr:hypothetical protein OS493_002337 [Desmophyllum pertusum]
MATIVDASALTEGLIAKWMTVNSAIFTPYVCKERADVELGTKAMVSNAKRLNDAITVAQTQLVSTVNAPANLDLLAMASTAAWMTAKVAHLIRTVIEESATV